MILCKQNVGRDIAFACRHVTNVKALLVGQNKN
jgi:hypothetical protein